jgi:hypothetical protein
MENPIRDRVRNLNSELRALLSRARDALVGRQDFAGDEIKAISESVGQMAPIVANAVDLRATNLELDAELNLYAKNLEELQNTLEKVRFMLIARHAHLEAARGHLETVHRWAAALDQTR